MAGSMKALSKASKINKKAAKLQMGFAAISLTIKELLTTEEESVELTRTFTTTVPKSWLFVAQHDHSQFYVKFQTEPLQPGHFDMILQLARHEGMQPQKQWGLFPCHKLGYFATYDESLSYIKGLVSQGAIVEPRLEPTDIIDIFNGIRDLTPHVVISNSVEPSGHGDQVEIQIHGEPQESLAGISHSSMQSHDSGLSTHSALSVSENEQSRLEQTSSLPDMAAAVDNVIHNTSDSTEVNLTLEGLWNRIVQMFERVNQAILDSEMRINAKLKETNDRINSVDAKTTNLQTHMNQLQNTILTNGGLQKNPDYLSYEEFGARYQLQLPFKKIDDMMTFEALFNDEKVGKALYNDLKKHLISTSDNHALVKKTCTDVFRRFFSRAILSHYVAQRDGKSIKKVEDKNSDNSNDSTVTSRKFQFKKTTFCSCLHDALSNVYYNPRDAEGKRKDQKIPDFDETILLREIGKVINDSKDWDGGRVERTRRSNENTADNESAKKAKKSSDHQVIVAENVLSISQIPNLVPANN